MTEIEQRADGSVVVEREAWARLRRAIMSAEGLVGDPHELSELRARRAHAGVLIRRLRDRFLDPAAIKAFDEILSVLEGGGC